MTFREIHLATVDSTIDYAKAHFDEFDLSGLTLVRADEQSGGKGTQGRRFASPKGGLYLSFCSALPKNFLEKQFAAQVLALATFEAVADLGLHPQLKWPNDLLFNGKKAAGFLAALSDIGAELLLINSVGLNVNTDKIVVDQPTTTLKEELGAPCNLESLKDAISAKYQINLEQFLKEGFTPFLPALKKALGISEEADPEYTFLLKDPYLL